MIYQTNHHHHHLQESHLQAVQSEWVVVDKHYSEFYVDDIS